MLLSLFAGSPQATAEAQRLLGEAGLRRAKLNRQNTLLPADGR